MQHKLFRLFFVLTFVLGLAMVSTPQTARAAGAWYVSTTGDDAYDCLSPTMPCATINGAIGKAISGDTILVAIGTYTSTGSEVVLIDKDVTLSGGWDETFTTQSGNSTIDGQMARGGMTVFGIATVENFAIQNGSAGSGAGIWNAGDTTINNSVISSNTATGYIGNYSGGGGIYNTGTMTLNDSILNTNIGFGITNEGTLTVNNSTVSDNQGYGIAVLYGSLATINSSIVSNNTSDGVFNHFNLAIDSSHISNNLGWGVQNWNGGNSTINNSSFSGNQTGGILQYSGGSLAASNSTISNSPRLGIQNWYGGSIVLNNSTVSSNMSGGIIQISGGNIALNNSTISNNKSIGAGFGAGAGIYADSGTVTLQNTLVAGNSANSSPDCWSPFVGPLVSLGYNLIGDISGCDFSPTTGDLINIDAKLGFLMGSPAYPAYHPLASDSPAIDAGNPSGCEGSSGLLTTDQRGATRIGICDIGAYEYTTPGSAVSLSLVNGSDQRAAVNSAFPEPLRAAALDGQGSPVSGVEINFTAPEDGASGIFADTGTNTTSVITDGAGIATTPIFTANNQPGSYAVSASAQGLGSVNINMEQVITPTNDNFGNPEVISSLPFTANADITNAGIEADEPQWCYFMPNTVWYSFSPTETIFVQVDTQGSTISSNVNIYHPTAPDISGLQFQFSECGILGNPSTFLAEAGQTYYFQVGAAYEEVGTVQINLQQVFPPANDNFANAEAITALPISALVNITDASTEPNEPQYSCFYSDKTVWYSFIATESLSVRIDMQGSGISGFVGLYRGDTPGITDLTIQRCGGTNSPIDIYRVEAGQLYYLQVGSLNGEVGDLQINIQEIPSPANDDFANAETITSLPFSVTADTSGAGLESSEPQSCVNMGGTVWYSFRPTETMTVHADTQGSLSGANLSIYHAYGSGISDQSFIGCTVYGYSNSATFLVEAGQTYYFQAGISGQGGGTIQINLQEIPRPANADFANPVAVTSLPFTATPDVTNAGVELNEPQYCYYMPDTVWYSFTPTEKTLVRADTQGSAISSNLNVYYDTGSGMSGLSFLPNGCTVYYGPVTFLAEAGQTYYFQAGGIYGQVGTVQVNLEQLPLPANDDFANATVASLPLPFDNTVDTQYSTRQTGEPAPSCAYYGPGSRSVWYAFTPTTSGSFSASIFEYAFTPVFAAYTGSSMGNLTQIGCQTSTGNLMTLHMNAGTTYYFQVGNLYPWEQGGSMQFHLDVTPPPQASFYTNPWDPSKYETVQFQDSSYDPGNVGIQSYTWDFGDGTTANGYSASHKYASDGDYQVVHAVTTIDGRTATITQTLQVRTHDVAITKIAVPASANVGQTKTITVTLRNIAYPETVQVDLYKSTPNGFVWIATVTKSIPALSGNRTTAVNFNYTFTSDDAKLGKVTFKAVATIVGARDAYPADNEKISSITKVAR